MSDTPTPTDLDKILKDFEQESTDAYTELEAGINYQALEQAYDKAKALIQAEIVKARIDELNQLYEEAESPEQYDTCEVVHDHRIAQRIQELTALKEGLKG